MLISSLGPPSTAGGKTVERNDLLCAQSLLRLRASKPDLEKTVAKLHICSRTVCNPQSEQMLIDESHLMGPPLTSNVYLCRYGTVHVCTPTACEHYALSNTQTCYISNFQMGPTVSFYDKNNSKSWFSKLEHLSGTPAAAGGGGGGKRIKPLTSLSPETMLERASDIVKLLLYSVCRHKRNLVAVEEYKQQANNAKNTYIRNQLRQQQLPFYPDVYRVRAFYSSQVLPLREYEYNPVLCNYYTQIVQQMWELVVETNTEPEKNLFDNIVIGTLYALQKGIILQNMTVLPKDDFLAQNLPSGSDLPYFGMERNRISKCDLLISNLYERAQAQQIPVQRMMIKFEKINV